MSYVLYPKPVTLNPKPYTLHPEPHTLHPTPYTPTLVVAAKLRVHHYVQQDLSFGIIVPTGFRV